MTLRRPRPPLTAETLDALALAYVGRFATTRAQLVRYLVRKVGERGWEGLADPQFGAIADRCVRNGFVDDAAFALSKARSLSGRGYGAGRLRQSLHAAGVGEEDSQPARALANEEAVQSALRLARRKRIGPFAAEPMERAARQKALAALVRGGHSFGLSKAIVSMAPGAVLDLEMLAEAAGRQID